MLKRAILPDKADRYKIKWIELSTQIKLAEKKVKQAPKMISDFVSQLRGLQVSNINMSQHKLKRARQKRATHREQSEKQRQQQKRKETKIPPSNSNEETLVAP